MLKMINKNFFSDRTMDSQPFVEGFLEVSDFQTIVNFYLSRSFSSEIKKIIFKKISSILSKLKIKEFIDIKEWVETLNQPDIKNLVDETELIQLVANNFDQEFKQIRLLPFLVNLIGKLSHFKGGIWKENFYGELPNGWSNGDYSESYPGECTGYFDCNLATSIRNRANGNFDKLSEDVKDETEPDYFLNSEEEKVELVWDFDETFEKPYGIMEGVVEEDDEDKFNQIIAEFYPDLIKLKDQLVCKGKINVSADSYNEDHRGSDHCLIKLPWQPSKILNSPTLKDLGDAFYLLRSHKWDNNYEMYCGSNLSNQKGVTRLNLEFDHGS